LLIIRHFEPPVVPEENDREKTSSGHWRPGDPDRLMSKPTGRWSREPTQEYELREFARRVENRR
jgi:hypothetical protein